MGGFTDLDGVFRNSVSFKEWWDYILSLPATLERNEKNKSTFKQKNARYIAFQEMIGKFNHAVKTSYKK